MDTLPPKAVEILLEVSVDEETRRYRALALDAEMRPATPELATALRSPALSLKVIAPDEESDEVSVVAYGKDMLGRVWPSTEILVLEVERERHGEKARELADDVVLLWPRLVAAAAA